MTRARVSATYWTRKVVINLQGPQSTPHIRLMSLKRNLGDSHLWGQNELADGRHGLDWDVLSELMAFGWDHGLTFLWLGW